ncbi:hypothetical protein PS2_000339 [Malus domestica]
MGRYQRHQHHQWRKVDKPCAAAEEDEDSRTTTFLMEFANSAPTPLFSLIYSTPMEDMKVNVPVCSSISNAAESAAHIIRQVTPGESLNLQPNAVHNQVTTLLAPFLVATHRQENLFFDGSKAELSAHRAVLRLRFSDAKVFSAP